MSASKNILVITKNGNFVAAVASKKKAEAMLRDLLVTDLKIKPAAIADAKVIDKDGVVSIDGTPHYRAKYVALQ